MGGMLAFDLNVMYPKIALRGIYFAQANVPHKDRTIDDVSCGVIDIAQSQPFLSRAARGVVLLRCCYPEELCE